MLCLLDVSQMGSVGDTTPPPTFYTYNYATNAGKPLLDSISIPSPTGRGMAAAKIQYEGSRVAAHIDANGNQRIFTYSAEGTRVEVKEPSGRLVQLWTQNIDAQGRYTGTTDAAGHRTTIHYAN